MDEIILTYEERKTLIQTEGMAAKVIIDEKKAKGEKLTSDDFELCRKIRQARIKI